MAENHEPTSHVDPDASVIPGLVLNTDFPTASWASVDSLLLTLLQRDRDVWLEARAGWNAVLFRYAECFEAGATLSTAFESPWDDMPRPGRRFIQERGLFEFFVAGMSALESATYTAFSVAAVVEPGVFPFRLDTDRYRVAPGSALSRFRFAFPDDEVTQAFADTLASPEFKRWVRWRNTLVHRAVPPRSVDMKAWPDEYARVGDDELRPETFHAYRTWLSARLEAIAGGIAAFVTTKVST